MGHLVDFSGLEFRIQAGDNENDWRFRLEIRGDSDALFDQLENVIAVFVGEEIATSRDMAWPERREFRVFRVE